MLPHICGRLAVIPFKLVIDRYIRSTRRRSRCRGALRDGTRPSQASTATLVTGGSWAMIRLMGNVATSCRSRATWPFGIFTWRVAPVAL
jgi:hypothetical protein